MPGLYLLLAAACVMSAAASAILKASKGLTLPLYSILGIGHSGSIGSRIRRKKSSL